MVSLKQKDLKEINGGGLGTSLLIGGIVVFIISVIDGYIRPLKCN